MYRMVRPNNCITTQTTTPPTITHTPQILPPHILAPLRGGTRVLVEKFGDVAVLCADVVGFSSLAAAADTADCIMTLNRLFSTFDGLTDKHGVHKVRGVTFMNI